MISETINYTLTLYLIFDLGNKKTNNWYNMRVAVSQDKIPNV